jgi:hypothetical protein
VKIRAKLALSRAPEAIGSSGVLGDALDQPHRTWLAHDQGITASATRVGRATD